LTGGGGANPTAPARYRPEFTLTGLTGFDGSVAGRPVLIAFRGAVYDVTDSFMWQRGRHFWHRAGRDLTAQIERSPHGAEVFERGGIRCIGTLKAGRE